MKLLHILWYCCILFFPCCIHFFAVAIYFLLLHAYFFCWSSLFTVASQNLLLLWKSYRFGPPYQKGNLVGKASIYTACSTSLCYTHTRTHTPTHIFIGVGTEGGKGGARPPTFQGGGAEEGLRPPHFWARTYLKIPPRSLFFTHTIPHY